MAHYQGRHTQLFDDICHRKGLARARNAKQSLIFIARFYAANYAFYRLGLVETWLEIAGELKQILSFLMSRLVAINFSSTML